MTPDDIQVLRLPLWAQRYICGLERRIDDAGKMNIKPGVVGFITQTRSEVRCAKMVEESVLAKEVHRARRALGAEGR